MLAGTLVAIVAGILCAFRYDGRVYMHKDIAQGEYDLIRRLAVESNDETSRWLCFVYTR